MIIKRRINWKSIRSLSFGITKVGCFRRRLIPSWAVRTENFGSKRTHVEWWTENSAKHSRRKNNKINSALNFQCNSRCTDTEPQSNSGENEPTYRPPWENLLKFIEEISEMFTFLRSYYWRSETIQTTHRDHKELHFGAAAQFNHTNSNIHSWFKDKQANMHQFEKHSHEQIFVEEQIFCGKIYQMAICNRNAPVVAGISKIEWITVFFLFWPFCVKHRRLTINTSYSKHSDDTKICSLTVNALDPICMLNSSTKKHFFTQHNGKQLRQISHLSPV